MVSQSYLTCTVSNGTAKNIFCPYRNLIAWDDLKKKFACDHELILSCKFYGLVADNLGFCTLKCQQIGILFIFECSL